MQRAVLPIVLSSFVLISFSSSPARAQSTDPVFLRAQQMVTAGQDSAGRAVVDSVLAATTDGTPRYAEALFWRATLAKTAAGAEQDYRRISVEYPLSPRAQEALLRLSQLEMTRGDRAGARAHLERLQREHPTGPTSTRANMMLARLAFEDGDLVTGCAAIAAARDGLTASDVELRNQLDYHGPRCANIAVGRDTAAASPTAAAGAATDSTAAKTAGAREDTAPGRFAERREYSVQVAAYDTRPAADALAQRLSARGYTVRVVGDRRPFRVRVGRYPTRERAIEAVRQMSRSNVRGLVVEAEPR